MANKNIDLIENSKFILDYLQKYKDEIPFPYNKIINISSKINKLTDYHSEGIKFKLIEYRGILKNKKEIRFYGYATSKKTRKLLTRWLLLNYLYNHNFSTPPFLVPRPLILFSKLNLFLREEAKGKDILEYIKKNKTQELKKGIFKAGQWLLRFHNFKIEHSQIIPTLKISEYLPLFRNSSENKLKLWKFTSVASIEEKEFRSYLEVAKKFFYKDTCRKIRKILNSIQRHTKLYLKKEKELSLNHGDFQPQNILYNKTNGNITVIDFDWAGVGDPLSDVGNFLIQFDYHSASVLKKQEIINLKKHFLDSYFQQKTSVLNRFNMNKDFAARINLYQAKFAIQRAIFNTTFILPRGLQPESNSTIKFLLQKAEDCKRNRTNIDLKVYPYNKQKKYKKIINETRKN